MGLVNDHWYDASRYYKGKVMEYKHPAKTRPENWKLGKRYFLPTGGKPFTLTGCKRDDNKSTYVIRCEYDSGTVLVKEADSLHAATTTDYSIKATVTKENDMNTLYEFDNNGKQTFGTKIAVNSSGLWVMEVKGTGEVLTVDKAKVEEVIPHSIGVKFLGNSQVYHYLAPKDKFTKGFYLFTNQNGTNLVEVTDLDTKSKQATKDFTPTLKFVTEVVDNSK